VSPGVLTNLGSAACSSRGGRVGGDAGGLLISISALVNGAGCRVWAQTTWMVPKRSSLCAPSEHETLVFKPDLGAPSGAPLRRDRAGSWCAAPTACPGLVSVSCATAKRRGGPPSCQYLLRALISQARTSWSPKKRSGAASEPGTRVFKPDLGAPREAPFGLRWCLGGACCRGAPHVHSGQATVERHARQAIGAGQLPRWLAKRRVVRENRCG